VTQAGLPGLLAGWAPEPAQVTQTVPAEPAVALAGLFDTEPPVTGRGDPLPPLWHWLYFLDRPAERDLGPDGHPAAGRFLPPIPQRRRMFAGGRVRYDRPIRCGDEITRQTELAGWKIRSGRTGELLFVTVRSTFTRAGTAVAVEEQDIIYRSGPPARPAPAAPAPPAAGVPGPAAPWSLRITADPVLLFRFSALTYNAHRIHYDEPYATGVEGHRGLVVHGPLLALLCLELPRRHRPGQPATRVSFRASATLFAGQPFTVTGGPGDGDQGDGDQGDGDQVDGDCAMRVTGPDAAIALTADASLAS
jgi:hydroxyacyl-ACP dehydratase HTD2-like protein with hotdog domain